MKKLQMPQKIATSKTKLKNYDWIIMNKNLKSTSINFCEKAWEREKAQKKKDWIYLYKKIYILLFKKIFFFLFRPYPK